AVQTVSLPKTQSRIAPQPDDYGIAESRASRRSSAPKAPRRPGSSRAQEAPLARKSPDAQACGVFLRSTAQLSKEELPRDRPPPRASFVRAPFLSRHLLTQSLPLRHRPVEAPPALRRQEDFVSTL